MVNTYLFRSFDIFLRDVSLAVKLWIRKELKVKVFTFNGIIILFPTSD
ncbi:MAG: hypothetical protein G01um101444_315 [Parcubacteria group bacterium Gr01-1014_44]|nr:MAG: hypothetical protein G01um101444_315 [Parcubacteria group bacterium Gr01-1014_44]